MEYVSLSEDRARSMNMLASLVDVWFIKGINSSLMFYIISKSIKDLLGSARSIEAPMQPLILLLIVLKCLMN